MAAICLGAGFFVAIAVWQVPIVELVVVGVLLKRTSNGIAKIQQLFQQAVAVESTYPRGPGDDRRDRQSAGA